jgi:predicted unusual protein kinase regulating ubiquinone biosynthesis (AarF/ABC1/UbiB family)
VSRSPRPEYASENTLGSRVRRYAQVGGTVGVQAARFAGARLLGRRLDGGNAADLKEALGGLKGPLMKVAQLMATIPDALPAEYAAELAQLQSNAPPMGKPFVRRRMMTELGSDWAKQFAEFPLEPSAAASLGQVHKVRLLDGRVAACKLQYPNMEAAVEADLSQLKLIFGLHARYDPAIDTSRIYQEISARLREELDYQQEARHLGLYAEMLADEANIHVPGLVPELCTRRLLTMEWLEGKPLLSFKLASQDERNRLALRMFRAWYVPFYRYGVIHGDPHLGNYTVRDDLDLNLLDFGCIRVFRPEFVKGVIDLYRALERGDRELSIEAYRHWGFDRLDHATVDVLNEWAAFLYGPLMENRSRLIEETNSSHEGRRVVERVHKKLREVGGVTPPREFVFMDRAAIGLGAVFMHLSAEINWHRLFMDLIADFDLDALRARQSAALARHGLAAPGDVS